eukprot:CAMPEP_0119360172 /NCGR_PEP_ID=MMETSP1334-20130426/7862_1 /TAXON_ID=127549 /ORGANISM="Calcidiscus leptoporus, Strain RCC1130" /LENGTH=78 /DNA_ID=CAMNT_0007374973 /DNA_START=57 /DNA_END=294 /DNA_ORIENTATION=-
MRAIAAQIIPAVPFMHFNFLDEKKVVSSITSAAAARIIPAALGAVRALSSSSAPLALAQDLQVHGAADPCAGRGHVIA